MTGVLGLPSRPRLATPSAPATAVPTAAAAVDSVAAFRLGEGVIPAGAIVRDVEGTIRATSFDEGWAVFKKKQPGTLVAVCGS